MSTTYPVGDTLRTRDPPVSALTIAFPILSNDREWHDSIASQSI